jgi:arsenate reductase
MAEGLLRQLAGDRFEAYSAGTRPKGIAPLTIEVMRELGIDVSAQRAKPVEAYAGQAFDYVITVCDQARESCPAFPGGAGRLHWSVEDPAEAEGRGEASLEAFRAARDDLRRRIEQFAREERGPARAVLRLPWRKRPVLFWRLLRDSRTPLRAKLLLPAVGLYLAMPLDVIPDFIPVIGYLDDILVLTMGFWLFSRLCPADVIEEQVKGLEAEAAQR